jgi:Bacterial archaeo-eukaryotic release factor family 10
VPAVAGNPDSVFRARTDAARLETRESTRVSIDRTAILDVARMRDPRGIVSMYVDVDPLEAASPSPTWQEAVHVELRRLECAERLHELRGQIADVVDPTRHGRGRALFFGVSGGGPVYSFAVQMPLETSVTMSEHAHLQPLLEALEAGRPVGIVIVSMAEVRAIEVAWGEVRDIVHVDVAPPPAEWSERKEPNRLHEEDRQHIVRTSEPRVEKLVRTRGWDRLVLAGNPRLTRPLAARIGAHGDATVIEAVRSVLPEDGAPAVASRLHLHVAAAAERRAAALLDRAHDGALSGGKGAIGADDVLRAVTEGRVQWVALARDAQLRAGPVEEGVAGVGLLDRTAVAELIIERAFETDAELAVLPGGAHPRLAEVGAAALLRW